MTPTADPYRVLGLAPGASLNEIRSAYRRLVKQYHPDAAGERALPRFLAIQAAYEALVDGEGRLRGARSSGGRSAGSGARPARDAWRARPRRDGGAASAAGQGAAGPGAAGSGAAGASAGPASGGSAPGARRRDHARSEGREGSEGTRSSHGHRTTRKATPGSTTYDEAAELPLDPPWDGGAWYGPSSGTFWTLNPREYADPRKHGPEYAARARRAIARTRRGRPEGGEPAP
jgi:curved DNA-binding protein CbpA